MGMDLGGLVNRLVDPLGVLGLSPIDSGKKDEPAVPQPVQPVADNATTAATPQQASDKARQAAAANRGRSGTVLTSPLGLLDPAQNARPQLLGQ